MVGNNSHQIEYKGRKEGKGTEKNHVSTTHGHGRHAGHLHTRQIHNHQTGCYTGGKIKSKNRRLKGKKGRWKVPGWLSNGLLGTVLWVTGRGWGHGHTGR